MLETRCHRHGFVTVIIIIIRLNRFHSLGKIVKQLLFSHWLPHPLSAPPPTIDYLLEMSLISQIQISKSTLWSAVPAQQQVLEPVCRAILHSLPEISGTHSSATVPLQPRTVHTATPNWDASWGSHSHSKNLSFCARSHDSTEAMTTALALQDPLLQSQDFMSTTPVAENTTATTPWAAHPKLGAILCK